MTAVANCNASLGKSDPFLPLRSIIEQLLNPKKNKFQATSNLAKTAGEFVIETAPDIIGIFFPVIGPLANIFAKAVKAASESNIKSKADDNISSKRSMIFEQSCQLLFKISKNSPLIIVLEDMQWADESTIEFLFHLTRSWEDQRIFVIATYREEDLAVGHGDHPLLVVQREMLAHNLCNKTSLPWLNDISITDWLSELFPENKLPREFATWILSRTKGNALFVTIPSPNLT